ncbi:MAG TPA: hypothetical protein VMA98_01320 [Candidatus Acidoferrales bacterium]|nr:hypothetical protein [Candidatus Acidoferrales bacterium]
MNKVEELAALEAAMVTAVERAGGIDPEIALVVPVRDVKVTETGTVVGADAAVVAHRKAHPSLYKPFEHMNDRELHAAGEQILAPGRTQAPLSPPFRELDASRLSVTELRELEKTMSSAGGGGAYDAGVLQRALVRQRQEDARAS